MSLTREAAIAAAIALLLPGTVLAQDQTTPPPTTDGQTTTTSPVTPTTKASPPTTTALPGLSQTPVVETPQPSAKTPPTPLPKKNPDPSVTGIKPSAIKPTTTFGGNKVPGQPLPSDPQSIKTLQDALAAALERNPTLLTTQEKAVQTNAQVAQILALRKPQVSASGSYSRLANPNSSSVSVSGVSPSQITNPFGVGLSYTPPGSSPVQLSTTTGTTGGAGTTSATGTSTTSTTSTSATTAGGSSTTSTTSTASAGGSGSSGTQVASAETSRADTRQTGSTGTGTGTTVVNTSTGTDLNQTNARLTVSQYIDITGIMRTAIQVGDLEKALSRLELARVRQQTVLTVTSAYYGVLKSLAYVSVNQAAVANDQELLRVTQAQLTAGVASQFDVLRAQTQLDNDQQALISSRNQVAISKNNLANQIGVDPSTIVDPQPVNVPTLPELDEEKLIQTAYNQRPEYLESDVNLLVAQKGIRLAHRNLDPYVNVGANGAYNANASAFTENKATAAVGVTLTVPLYDGGQTRALQDAAKSQVRGAEIQKDQFVRGIKAEIQQAVIAVRDANDRSSTIASTVAQAQEALRLANVRYRAGVGTQLDVTTAQATLVQAESNQVNALYDYLSALATLSRAVGTPA